MLPDIIGFKLFKAKEILQDKGYTDIKIIVTSPICNKKPNSNEHSLRVIRSREINSFAVELLVC